MARAKQKVERLSHGIENAISALGRATTVAAVAQAKRTLRSKIRAEFKEIRGAFEQSERW